MKNLLLILAVFVNSLSAQNESPEKILEKVKENFARVKSYTVDINVKVDVNFLKVPDTEAKLYFEEPDKIHFESENFALLPKEGLNFSPTALLSKKYTAILEKHEMLDGINTTVIKIIPLNDQSDVILTTIWIDESKNVIKKVESSTRIGGTYSIKLNYDNQNLNYPLPSSMIFTFNADKMNVTNDLAQDSEESIKKKSKSKSTTGKVYVTYKNYKVNVNIPDDVFQKK